MVPEILERNTTGRTPSVLLVDDYSDTTYSCSLFLTGAGYKVEQATSGEEALQKLERLTPDAIIADILLPGIDGFALCRRIKSNPHTAHVPVIGVSGYSSPGRTDEAARAGFDALLTKPCSPSTLLDALRTAVGNRELTKA